MGEGKSERVKEKNIRNKTQKSSRTFPSFCVNFTAPLFMCLPNNVERGMFA